MRAQILDKASLDAISPMALRSYLIFEGWSKSEAFGQFSEVYRAKDSESEIVIPVSREIADYAAAISEALAFIAKVENRDQLSIYRDLVRSDRDVVRVRAPKADDDGSIPIDPGVELVLHARNLLASAACAAVDPRRAYHLGKLQRAADYMRKVRLGQTEVGSFVVTLLAPIPPVLTAPHQQSFWPSLEQDPYERKVTRVLTQALHAAHDAVVQSARGDGLQAFATAVKQGVSANLCEAVASIVEHTESIDISVTWARTRPTPLEREAITFDRSDGEILKEAARQFRLREPRRDERILGYVTDLHRAEDQNNGRAVVKALIDGRVRSLPVSLNHFDYETALLANGTQVPITLVGDLEPEGERWRLVDPRGIQLVQGDEPEGSGRA